MNPINISIVIPVFNERGNIENLYKEITNTLHDKESYEIVFIDDGSTDDSFKILKKISSENSRVRVVKLMSNYGQSSAIAAGISNSKGKIIITMDSDLQHDPKDIIPLIEKIKEGYHVVCGWRKQRNSSDSLIMKTIPSRIANMLVRIITGKKLNDSTGGMRAFKKQVTDNIDLYGEMHRYLPILAAWKGFKITEAGINIRDRKFGKTHYNFKRLFRGFLDLLTIKFLISYSTRPLYIFGGTGLISFAIGFLIALYLTIQKLFFNLAIGSRLPLFMLSILLIISGLIFLCFGFIADMIALYSIKKRKLYIIEKII